MESMYGESQGLTCLFFFFVTEMMISFSVHAVKGKKYSLFLTLAILS